ncbi:MAG: hypothetical protein R3C52_10105 [Hyphomonadaceae bacterium]
MAKSKNSTPIQITVLRENSDKARQLFLQAGFCPRKQLAPDAYVVTFIFAAVPDEDVWRLLQAVPREMYAYQGVITGGTKR